MKKFIIFLLIPFIFSCSPKYSKEEVSIITKINNTDDNIKFPIEKEAEIWSKTQLFMATYVATPMKTITPEMILTPGYEKEAIGQMGSNTMYSVKYQYSWSINKIKYEKDFQLIIKVKWNNVFGGGQEMEEFQKKALIHYLKTGEVVPKLMDCYYCKPNKITAE